MQPRLGDAVTQALRERLQTDGTYHLTTHGGGDIVVSGVITRYNREGLSYLNNDVATTENYRVGVIARVTAREPATGKVLFDKEVKGYTWFTSARIWRTGTDSRSRCSRRTWRKTSRNC